MYFQHFRLVDFRVYIFFLMFLCFSFNFLFTVADLLIYFTNTVTQDVTADFLSLLCSSAHVTPLWIFDSFWKWNSEILFLYLSHFVSFISYAEEMGACRSLLTVCSLCFVHLLGRLSPPVCLFVCLFCFMWIFLVQL